MKMNSFGRGAKLPQLPNHQLQKHPRKSHLLLKKHALLEYSAQSQKVRTSTEKVISLMNVLRLITYLTKINRNSKVISKHGATNISNINRKHKR